MRDQTFEYRGYQCFYVEGGEGPPMVFLHNGGTSHGIWDKQLAHFAQRYHVYGPDLLGFGKSDKPDIDYPLEVHLGQLEAFVKHIGAKKLTLVGHCMGGAACLNFTVRHPEMVDKLVLCNVYTAKTLEAGSLADLHKQLTSSPQVLAAACEKVSHEPCYYPAYNSDSQTNVTLMKVIARADTYGVSDDIKLPAGMPPVLMVWGAENPILPLSAGQAFRDRLHPDQFIELAGCQHLAMVDNPELFIDTMEQFLKSSDSKATSQARK